MSEVGLRKGKRRGINTVALISKKESKKAELKELYGSSIIGSIYSDFDFKEGEKAYIAIFPKEDGNSVLKEIHEEENRITALFESARESKSFRAELHFDNRGRARNLEKGKSYVFRIFRKHDFFRSYEIKSIPSGKKGKSEPEELGMKRIRAFMKLLSEEELDNKVACDFAAGIKEYLKLILRMNSKIISMNISESILKQVRNFLKSDKAFFIAYDADSEIPLKDNTLDLAICDALLEYIDDPFSFLEKITKKIKKTASLLLLEPIRASKSIENFYPQDMFEFAIYRAMKDKNFKKEKFEKKLSELGFEVKKREKIEFAYDIFGEKNFEQSVALFKHY